MGVAAGQFLGQVNQQAKERCTAPNDGSRTFTALSPSRSTDGQTLESK